MAKASKPCSVEGCDGGSIARGWCRRHYARWVRRGEPGPAGLHREPHADRRCIVEGCDRGLHSHDYCAKHYRRLRLTGEVANGTCAYCDTDLGPDRRKRHCPTHEVEHARIKKFAETIHKHGISVDDYHRMLIAQNHRCAICGGDDPGVRRWNIDHDHACCAGGFSCGRCVRGLLCQHCNACIGLARDNPTILRRAAEYVERARLN